MRPKAFTLIELLVVITIIVVLLALLTPALDKAIYEAELVQCAANQKSIGFAATTYATNFNRWYPTTGSPRLGGSQPHLLGIDSVPQQDIRVILADYVPLKMMADPLSEPVDLSPAANDDDTGVYSSYQFWMGWQYTGAWGGRGMRKIGDRLEWVDDLTNSEARTVSHNFLISGLNSVRLSNAAENAHADHDGRATARVQSNQDWISGLEGVGVTKVTVSFWETAAANGPRGLVDQNFASADGSAVTLRAITGAWNDVQDQQGTIFYAAPWHADSGVAHNTDMRYMPAR